MGLTRRDPQDRPSSSTSVPTTRLLLLERRELDPSSLLPRNQRPRSLLLKNQRPRNLQLRSPPKRLHQRRSKLASFQNRNICIRRPFSRPVYIYLKSTKYDVNL